MTKKICEPRDDMRSAEFPKYSAKTHYLAAMRASHTASLAGPLREEGLQMEHEHKFAATEAETSERREALAEILKTVEAEELKGPRDLDVALDAIEALFKEAGKP